MRRAPATAADRRGQARPARTGVHRWLLTVLLVATAGGCARDAGRERNAAEIEALVDSLLPHVARLAALDAREPVRVARQSQAEVRAYVERRLDEQMAAPDIRGMHRTYAMLGLMPDSLDLRALLLELYAEQIAGYYDPETRTLYVVQGGTADPRPLLAHEIVHALQDQHSDVDSLVSHRRGNDRQLAAQAALEGHAMLVMYAFMVEAGTNAVIDPVTLPDLARQIREGVATQGSAMPVLRTAPRVIRETLLFVYADGARFVQELWRSRRDSGARPPPLGAFLPQSTEQIMFPLERFVLDRDVPAELRFGDAAGGQVRYENTLGAFETGIFLQERLGTPAVVASGWDGDRYRLLESAAGHALVWISVWDDEPSASRFADFTRRILAQPSSQRAGRVETLTLDQRPAVRVTITEPPHTPPVLDVHCIDEAGTRVACL